MWPFNNASDPLVGKEVKQKITGWKGIVIGYGFGTYTVKLFVKSSETNGSWDRVELTRGEFTVID